MHLQEISLIIQSISLGAHSSNSFSVSLSWVFLSWVSLSLVSWSWVSDMDSIYCSSLWELDFHKVLWQPWCRHYQGTNLVSSPEMLSRDIQFDWFLLECYFVVWRHHGPVLVRVEETQAVAKLMGNWQQQTHTLGSQIDHVKVSTLNSWTEHKWCPHLVFVHGPVLSIIKMGISSKLREECMSNHT